jgi:hypothetical protein
VLLIAGAVVGLLAGPAPAPASASGRDDASALERDDAGAHERESTGAHKRDYAAAAYRGLAAWVDVYDHGPWDRPEQMVSRMARRGVGTLFVQTSNYRLPRPLHRPAALDRLLAAAEEHGIFTVAWYLPGLDDPERDWRRVRAAVTHVTPEGHSFDGFAMDIEATLVGDIGLRNRRMLGLSRRLRGLVGGAASVGAIIPDPVTQRYWPRFPYRQVRALYDALLPMSYWTFRVRGAGQVYRYTRSTLRLLRERTGDPFVPIHPIGGIANSASIAEVRGFARAAVAFGAAGASLYDAPITSPAQWRQLERITARGSAR